MLLPVALYLVSSFVQQSLQNNITAKCCEKTLQIQEINNRLQCQEITNSRYQILAESHNFLKDNSEGECVDFNGENVFVYEVSESKLTSKKPILNPFPKCCPLGYAYSREIRACSKNENITEDFIKGNFIKIGLPHCRIILDHKRTLDEIFEQLKNSKAISEEKSLGEGGEGSFCVDNDAEGGFVIRQCQDDLSVCNETRCFKKCCPDGKSYVGGAKCRDTYEHGIQIGSQYYSDYIENSTDENYHLIYGAGCRIVSLVGENKIQYSIDGRGAFRYYSNYTLQFEEHHYSLFESYCIEHARKDKISGYNLFWCLDKKTPNQQKFSDTLWAKILSCILLLVVIFVYIYLGEIKSTFGKILINYCLVVILLMGTLSVAQKDLRPTRTECLLRAYATIFFHFATFAWVNVMSLDIWWTFGTPRRTIGSDQRKKDLKKFVCYFLYGWGVPLCHTLLMFILAHTEILPKSVHPYIGVFKCLVERRAENYAYIVFILIPQLVFQVINTVLFIKTITYCIKVKNEINKMNDSTKHKASSKLFADKERLTLIIKLAIIMGITWIFEVITAFFQLREYNDFTKYLEVVLDTIICLQGVFIFIIFICKKKTLTSIKNKLGFHERRISTSTSIIQSNQNINGHYPMNKRQTTLSISDQRL